MRGIKLAIEAMKKEHKRLSAVAEKAKRDADEYMNISSEFIAIHQEYVTVANSKQSASVKLKKLDELQRRRDKAEKIMNKDFIKLLDKQSDAEIDRDELAHQISKMEFQLSLYFPRQRATRTTTTLSNP
ncbi:MAG: hypothetical protein ACXV8Q_00690 [Methylobacter sp.]